MGDGGTIKRVVTQSTCVATRCCLANQYEARSVLVATCARVEILNIFVHVRISSLASCSVRSRNMELRRGQCLR